MNDKRMSENYAVTAQSDIQPDYSNSDEEERDFLLSELLRLRVQCSDAAIKLHAAHSRLLALHKQHPHMRSQFQSVMDENGKFIDEWQKSFKKVSQPDFRPFKPDQELKVGYPVDFEYDVELTVKQVVEMEQGIIEAAAIESRVLIPIVSEQYIMKFDDAYCVYWHGALDDIEPDAVVFVRFKAIKDLERQRKDLKKQIDALKKLPPLTQESC